MINCNQITVLMFTFLALALFKIKHTEIFSLKILSTVSSASLFVTLLGAWLVRNPFVLGLRPRISYKSGNIYKKELSEKIWQVKLYNSGLGGAIINRCEFELETSPIKNNSLSVGFKDVVEHLGKIGLVHESDYWLENISSGFTLSPKEDYIVFEIKAVHVQKMKHLNTLLHFHGFLESKYFRSVVLVQNVVAKTEK